MIIISKAVIGKRPGIDHVVYPGERVEVSDLIGKALIEEGYAVQPSVTNQAAPTVRKGVTSSEGSNVQETPAESFEGMIDLEGKTYTELKAMAQEMGIETGKLKSKAAMIDAITAELDEFTEEEDLPNLAPQEVID